MADSNSLVIGRVDEVTTSFVVGIEQLETVLLVLAAQADLGPLVTDAHPTELNRRDVHTSVRRELAMDTELRLGFGSGCEDTHRA